MVKDGLRLLAHEDVPGFALQRNETLALFQRNTGEHRVAVQELLKFALGLVGSAEDQIIGTEIAFLVGKGDPLVLGPADGGGPVVVLGDVRKVGQVSLGTAGLLPQVADGVRAGQQTGQRRLFILDGGRTGISGEIDRELHGEENLRFLGNRRSPACNEFGVSGDLCAGKVKRCPVRQIPAAKGVALQIALELTNGHVLQDGFSPNVSRFNTVNFVAIAHRVARDRTVQVSRHLANGDIVAAASVVCTGVIFGQLPGEAFQKILHGSQIGFAGGEVGIGIFLDVAFEIFGH